MDFSEHELREYVQSLEVGNLVMLMDNVKVKFGKDKVSLGRKKNMDSLDTQCSEFIANLQQGYPGTISTLTKIGGKLQPEGVGQDNPRAEEDKECAFCGVSKVFSCS